MSRMGLVLVLAGCPKSTPPVAVPEEPPPPAEHSFQFAWPDGAWGFVVREHGLEGVVLRSELDVGVSLEAAGIEVRENLRLQRVEPEEAEIPQTLVLYAWQQRLPWTWQLDGSGRRAAHADRREAAKPFYDPQDIVDPLVDELWLEAEPEVRNAQREQLMGVVPGHLDFQAVTAEMQSAWNIGLPMLHGRTLRQGAPVSDTDEEGRQFRWSLGADVACGPKGKDVCATLDVLVEQEGAPERSWSWTVEPTTLLPWAMSGHDGTAEITETWSWTVR